MPKLSLDSHGASLAASFPPDLSYIIGGKSLLRASRPRGDTVYSLPNDLPRQGTEDNHQENIPSSDGRRSRFLSMGDGMYWLTCISRRLAVLVSHSPGSAVFAYHPSGV